MDGFLNVLKPKGITSHDAVLQVRRVFNRKRAGHLGTLDPMAQGVLPVALGCYTRLSEYLLDEEKEYLAEFTFGISTDTCDFDGRITSERPCAHLTASDVSKLLSNYTGEIKQIPPAYSAVQVKGQRLHNLARRGIRIEAPERDVTVHEFCLLHWKPGTYPRGIFRLRVGRGTYVRSAARDLGDELGCGAAVSYLLRTRVGTFLLKDSVLMSSLKGKAPAFPLQDALVNPYTVFAEFPLFEIRPDSITSVIHGRPLEPGAFRDPGEIKAWVRRTSESTCKKKSVFIGAYTDDITKRQRIACVLSAAQDGDELYRIKYEKVLIQEE